MWEGAEKLWIASDGFVAGIKGFFNFGIGALTGGAGLWNIPKGTAPGLLNLATKMFLNTVIGGVLRLSVDAIYATILGEECTWIKGIKSIMDWVF